MTTTEDYLGWLYEQVGLPGRVRTRSYRQLFEQMYAKEFVGVLLKDQARAEDGKELRWQFVRAAGLRKVPAAWMYAPCSMLEMFIALAQKMADMSDDDLRPWFTQLLFNIGLDKYPDSAYMHPSYPVANYVNEVLECLNWRKYNPDGTGGLFPLDRPNGDQRQVEIWYQMNAWLIQHQNR